MVARSPGDRAPRRPIRSIVTMVLVSAFCGVLVAGLLLPVASFVGLSARNVATGFENLPLDLEQEPTPQRTTVLDSRGRPLAYFYNQNRTDIPLQDVAPVMQEAILAIEDARFYEHGAIDVRGTLRAFINNAADGATQGGSSITQQLVKQILVTQAETRAERAEATETSYSRKLRELQFAMAYEREYSKDQILESYLNIAYFGDSAYGIQEAAQHYFSVDAADLNVKQAATLSGLVQNPSAYNPTRFPDAAITRRNIVLARMAQLDLIREQRAERIIGSDLGLEVRQLPNGCVSTDAPFFCSYVQNFLLEDDALGATPRDRLRTLNEGGLTISTTVDLRHQRAADSAVQATVDPTDLAIGSISMVEPGSGEVKAIAQSRPMGNARRDGETYLNYSVPKIYGNANGFQAGSTFKLFVLASALRQGAPPSTSFNTSSPYELPSDTTYRDCAGNDWVGSDDVSNSTGDGYFDMYEGTQDSVNIYFMKLEQFTGICKPAELARQMGLEVPTTDEVPTFALGVTDVSSLDMASAYATFAARGEFCAPHPVTQVLDSDGETLISNDGNCRRLMSRPVADTINDILRGVQQFGFGVNNQLSVPSAAKTGTTQNGRTVAYAGYTPALSTFATIAGVDRAGNPAGLSGKVIGGSIRDISGSGFAGPMWAQAMRALEDVLPNRNFAAPDLSRLGDADVGEEPPFVPPPFVPPAFPSPPPGPTPDPGPADPDLPGDGSPDDPRPAPNGPGGQGNN
ncbi:MAG: transglycosylase domain-containing protein [Nocardioidaceae bacterium]